MYKILIADDEQKIREVIKEYAEYEGHTVYEAVDGMQAVAGIIVWQMRKRQK